MRKDRVAGAIIALIIVVILAAFTALGVMKSKQPHVKTQAEIKTVMGVPVKVTRLTQGDIQETVAVTGDIRALTSMDLSAKTQGRVARVMAREGDVVTAGQTLVALDPTEAQSQVRSAEAGLSAARARLSQAVTTAEAQEKQSSAAIAQARAGLEIARAQLAVVRKGARTQERLVAENAVRTAKANLDNAESNYKRYQTLHKQGAVSAQQLDMYKTQYDIAKEQHNSAQQQLSLIREGARPEDITAAQNQVRAAAENLRTAQAAASQVQVRWEDVKGARAGVQQAQAALTGAREQLGYTSITTSVSGVVAARSVEPGQVANPGQPLMTVVDLRNMYFEADVSEREVENLRVGQPVLVRVDATPGRSYEGRVAKILPVASTQSRNFSVRIQSPNPAGELRPGMFARGNIVVRMQQNVLLVPKDALVQRKGDNLLFVADNGKAKLYTVQVGLTGADVIQITDAPGLLPGAEVVTAGRQGLQDGMKIYVEES